MDIACDRKLECPGTPADLQNVTSIGLRILFDWRHYW